MQLSVVTRSELVSAQRVQAPSTQKASVYVAMCPPGDVRAISITEESPYPIQVDATILFRQGDMSFVGKSASGFANDQRTLELLGNALATHLTPRPSCEYNGVLLIYLQYGPYRPYKSQLNGILLHIGEGEYVEWLARMASLSLLTVGPSG